MNENATLITQKNWSLIWISDLNQQLSVAATTYSEPTDILS